jgi:hypothetical protein
VTEGTEKTHRMVFDMEKAQEAIAALETTN